MAQSWAIKFYHSTAWLRCREIALKRDHYLCQRCGNPAEIVHHRIWLTPDNITDPYVALSLDNLQCLCQDCHNGEHNKSDSIEDGLLFDKNGDLIKEVEWL